MTENERTRLSKFLSLVLRHRPAVLGLTLDPQGWIGVDELLAAAAARGQPFTRAELDEVVATNDKQRFAFSPDGARIRASQGHSVPVDLALPPAEPPETLYHGTVARFLPSIRADGLRPGQRQQVHLSRDRATAAQVGERRGEPVVLEIAAGRMHRDGLVFHQSANGVWLTAAVPPEYLRDDQGDPG